MADSNNQKFCIPHKKGAINLRMKEIILIVMVSIVLTGCSEGVAFSRFVFSGFNNKVYNTYQYDLTSKLKREEYAVVRLLSTLYVDRVDGKATSSGVVFIALLPGKHNARVYLSEESINNKVHGDRITLEFEVKGNHTYMFEYETTGFEKGNFWSTKKTGKWKVYLKDITDTSDHLTGEFFAGR